MTCLICGGTGRVFADAGTFQTSEIIELYDDGSADVVCECKKCNDSAGLYKKSTRQSLRETKNEILKQIEQLESMQHYVEVDTALLTELYRDYGKVTADLDRLYYKDDQRQYYLLAD